MDPIFDAIAEVTGLDPSTAGGRIGTAAAKLYRAKQPYTPEEIHEFARRFWEFCPHAADKNRQRPTPHEIANHIGLLRAKPAPPQSAPVRQSAKPDAAATYARQAHEAMTAGGES